jgi:glycerol-3-phosphate dehydrogenase (NAD(P)+)
MSSQVAVIGAGSWGTTIAAVASQTTVTRLWARTPKVADEITRAATNSTYLPGFSLPPDLVATASLEAALRGANLVLMAVPSHGFRAVAAAAAPCIEPGVPIVSLAKGLEQGTLMRMSEVLAEVAPGHPVAVMTGPNLAREILAGQPAASVVASHDHAVGIEMQRVFAGSMLRIYTNVDVVGCEIAGVVKNVLAIASGMADGMGFGDNTRAALMTRGLAEMARLGVALGGSFSTFAGLAGMGDLIATCASGLSRNHMVGRALGRGSSIEQITSDMLMVAEGVKSSPAVLALAHRLGVDMPFTDEVVAVCHGGRSAADAVERLMKRETKGEIHGLPT